MTYKTRTLVFKYVLKKWVVSVDYIHPMNTANKIGSRVILYQMSGCKFLMRSADNHYLYNSNDYD
jgi:hypothetical protein